ncbi:helix-turn-helix transcriptional regulator [Proteiniborus sp. MB09-C3]|uniref:helix-turn-helix domain-containing protein n=1 Tax=Proteiniborus sp. MB09-C3 TaxID=3050072 RepID=UPI0025558B4A|nr:helix-turn-helix transcriptional regulator [Proteiniborus sp. MB09-C3]WIV10522.1 helix-turn-helix transcriptional regulator [Proteiniborus sp. MB09-C3]
MLKSNLRVIMAKRKIDSITELIELSGLSRNAINKIYKEEKIEASSLETFIKLCNALNCKLSELIEYIPD